MSLRKMQTLAVKKKRNQDLAYLRNQSLPKNYKNSEQVQRSRLSSIDSAIRSEETGCNTLTTEYYYDQNNNELIKGKFLSIHVLEPSLYEVQSS